MTRFWKEFNEFYCTFILKTSTIIMVNLRVIRVESTFSNYPMCKRPIIKYEDQNKKKSEDN